MSGNARLIILGGLPGTGKTTLAHLLAARIGAVHLRVDAIEQVIRAARPDADLAEAGYRIAYAVAGDNLRVGRTVIADSVNPLPVTREAWRAVAASAGTSFVEIEVICSDAGEHRRRVETRATDIDGLILPTWQQVRDRDYAAWDLDGIVVDTAGRPAGDAVEEILALVAWIEG